MKNKIFLFKMALLAAKLSKNQSGRDSRQDYSDNDDSYKSDDSTSQDGTTDHKRAHKSLLDQHSELKRKRDGKTMDPSVLL